MNKKQTSKIFCLTCISTVMLASTAYGLWPTTDVAQRINIINSVSTQIESTSSTVQSTLSIGKIQQAIGDNVGSLSKFTNAAEDAKKAAEELEKQKKRAERLREIKEKYEEQKEKIEDTIDEGKETAEQLSDTAKDKYEDGVSLYESGKTTLGQSSGSDDSVVDNTDEDTLTTQEQEDVFTSGENHTTTENKTPDNNNTNDDTADLMDDEALDDEAIADLISDEEFSEGGWDDLPTLDQTETLNGTRLPGSGGALPETGILPPNTIGRRPFTPNVTVEPVAVGSETIETGGNPTAETNEPTAAFEETTAEEEVLLPQTEGNTGQPTEPELSSSSAPLSTPASVTSSTSTSAAPSVTRRAFRIQKGTVENTAPTLSAPVDNAPTVAPMIMVPAADAAKPVEADVSVNPAIAPMSIKQRPARRAFTTSSADSFYQSTRPFAFAQTTETSSSYKTGTTDNGKFIYSDIIANKCGINFDDEFDEETWDECVKEWVMAMNDPNAETAAEWRKAYNEAEREHVSADLGMALVQKSYAAAFDTEVAKDLESKSQALTNEREEIAFAGKVAQTNQEIIIRLMEAMTGQVITGAWSSVKLIEKGYYDEEEANEDATNE